MQKQNMKALDTTINTLDERRKAINQQMAVLKKEAEDINTEMMSLYNAASPTEKAYMRSKLKRIKANGIRKNAL